MADQEYPFGEDEFDVAGRERVPEGVHRRPRSPWRVALPFVLALVIGPALAFVAMGYVTSETSSTGVGTEVSASPAATDGVSPEATTSPEVVVSDEAAGVAPPRDVRVVVLNGTGVPRLAAGAAERLKEDGFTSLVTGNARSRVPTRSTVYYHSDELRPSAERVAQLLGVETLLKYPTATPTVAVVLRNDATAGVLGADAA